MNSKLFCNSHQCVCEKKEVVESVTAFVPIFFPKENELQLPKRLFWISYFSTACANIYHQIYLSHFQLDITQRSSSQTQNFVNHYEYDILGYLYPSLLKAFNISTKVV